MLGERDENTTTSQAEGAVSWHPKAVIAGLIKNTLWVVDDTKRYPRRRWPARHVPIKVDKTNRGRALPPRYTTAAFFFVAIVAISVLFTRDDVWLTVDRNLARAKSVGETLTFVAVVLAFYVTWKKIETSEAQVAAAHRNTEIAHRNSITDVFYKATEQLGDTSETRMSSRLGGIFALERLSRDSAHAGDKSAVAQVLTAFAREDGIRKAHTKANHERVAIDVETIFKVLCKVDNPTRDGDEPLDLRGAYLKKLSISKVTIDDPKFDLEGSILDGADLSHSDLRDIKLNGASLKNAILEHSRMVAVELSGAKMSSCRMRKAQITDGDLDKADLARANLIWASLAGASVREATLIEARLDNANLTEAVLKGSNLEKAILTKARLKKARMDKANMEDADLRGAWLEGAVLSGASMAGANLAGAKLQGANLATAKGVTQRMIELAEGDQFTRLPTGLEMPYEWLEEHLSESSLVALDTETGKAGIESTSEAHIESEAPHLTLQARWRI